MSEPALRSSSKRLLLGIELAFVMAAALWGLWFHATLPGRVPTDADYRALAQAVRPSYAVGDFAAVLPEWAERARMFLPGVPFVAVPDLAHADLSRVRRLWVIEQPDLPRSDVARARAALAAALRADGPPRKFGPLVLERFTNPGFHEPRFDFTRDVARARVWLQLPGRRIDCPRDGQHFQCGRGLTVGHEVREIQFTPYDCVGANPVGRDIPLVVDYPGALLGKTLRILAGVTGEMGWRHGEGQTPVTLSVSIDGQPQGTLTIPVGTVPPQHLSVDTSAFDPSRPHDVQFAVRTQNNKDREFCFDAQSE